MRGAKAVSQKVTVGGVRFRNRPPPRDGGSVFVAVEERITKASATNDRRAAKLTSFRNAVIDPPS
jgi:hypothetical protein